MAEMLLAANWSVDQLVRAARGTGSEDLIKQLATLDYTTGTTSFESQVIIGSQRFPLVSVTATGPRERAQTTDFTVTKVVYDEMEASVMLDSITHSHLMLLFGSTLKVEVALILLVASPLLWLETSTSNVQVYGLKLGYMHSHWQQPQSFQMVIS